MIDYDEIDLRIIFTQILNLQAHHEPMKEMRRRLNVTKVAAGVIRHWLEQDRHPNATEAPHVLSGIAQTSRRGTPWVGIWFGDYSMPVGSRWFLSYVVGLSGESIVLSLNHMHTRKVLGSIISGLPSVNSQVLPWAIDTLETNSTVPKHFETGGKTSLEISAGRHKEFPMGRSYRRNQLPDHDALRVDLLSAVAALEVLHRETRNPNI